MPAWKKAKKLVIVGNKWLSKNLNSHLVIIDVRPAVQSAKSHIKTAVSLEAGKIQHMGRQYASKRRGKSKGELYEKRILPSLPDKYAPIILYGADTRSRDVKAAFRELLSWKYKSVAVLDGGITAWNAGNLPVTQGPAGTKIRYIKKLAKGAVSREEFAGLIEKGGAVILDVRSAGEVKNGKLGGSVHIPLDDLEARLGELSRTDRIIVHCATGARAGIAYNLMNKNGFKNVSYLNSIFYVDKPGTYRFE